MHPIAASKQAEKDYLRRSGSLAWEMVKPFSPRGSQTLQESVRLIHDFAVAAAALELLPGHRVLDLGVGAGWTTEWLRRLNVDVTGLDIAHDMLLVGKHRILPPQALVAGDLEALPFRAESFDRAMSLNALHHVPDPAVALRQIHQVLKDHGRLVLIEPGAGHADRETSRNAVDQFGVLERDLPAQDLMRLCHEAGFGEVVIRPLSYASGEIQLSLQRLIQWNRWTRLPRHLRVVRKFWQLLPELFGMSKEGALFEESLGMWVSRVLARHMSEQAVVVAGKSTLVEVSPPYAAELQVVDSLTTQSNHVLTLRCRNIGTAIWRAHGKHGAQVGVQLLDRSRHLLDREYARAALPCDVLPQQECVVRCTVPTPEQGTFLRMDIVIDDVTWVNAGAPTGVLVQLADSRD
jgi:SAM-dependent methyltransferase